MTCGGCEARRPLSSAGLAGHRFHECLDVAERVSARTPAAQVTREITIAFDARAVVINEDTPVAHISVEAHRAHHIDIACVDELFVELRDRRGDVPEVDIQNLVARPEIANRFVDIVAHFREGPLAEFDSIGVARIDLNQAAIGRVIAKQPRLAGQAFNGRIVWMDAQANAFLLGNRSNLLDPVLQTLPHLLFANGLLGRLGHVVTDDQEPV